MCAGANKYTENVDRFRTFWNARKNREETEFCDAAESLSLSKAQKSRCTEMCVC